ncbi:hypothetical protein [Shewanella sp. MTB7]|uniref:hypothetical protein n=2 Tax=Shewanella sp. MTB7 TaxID=2746932 RepID=UPI0022BA5DA5|nr:hypothetical protein [Shewanella sp. MTB7]WBJ95714.1 replication endonuclease [Shewanella sp. MTB7]
MTRYAFQVDGHEKGAKEKRLDIKPIDKRGAVGYVIKYLSKNIEGEFMQGELDLEANVEVSEGAKFARAWASRYHLRQFQFYGTESVQVWRELRRIKVGPQSPEIEAAKSAACASDWKGFEAAMKTAKLTLSYDITECGNEYGEVVKRVQGLDGIAFGQHRNIITRGEKWTLRGASDTEKDAYQALKKRRALFFFDARQMPENERMSKKELKKKMPRWKQPQHSGLSPLPVASALPWTCRNNCTGAISSRPRHQISEDNFRELASNGVTDPHTLDQIANGSGILTDRGKVWWLREGQLWFEHQLDEDDHEFEFF